MRKYGRIGFAVLLAFLATGCTAGRTYRMDLAYRPANLPGVIHNLAQPPRVAVVLFQDLRAQRTEVGYRVRLNGATDLFKTNRASVPMEVTEAVAQYFQLRGYDVKVFSGSEKPPRGADSPYEYIVEGQVDNLQVAARDSLGWTQLDSQVKLSSRIYAPRSRFTQTVGAEASNETKVILFGTDTVQSNINQALAQAIDQMFKRASL